MRMFEKNPRVNEIWFDSVKNKHFYIVGKCKDDDVYKPYDVLYEDNQVRYLPKTYIKGQCIFKGKAKNKFETLFEVK